MVSDGRIAYQKIEVVDTFAEAFPMVGTRLIITAVSEYWAQVAANQITGYATSVIACDSEAGVEKFILADESPDGRPGVSILLFSFGSKGLEKAVVNRVGQCILTCPTTACFNGLTDTEKQIDVGGQLRYFGDGFQSSKKLGDQRFWRIPVMDGEFLCEEKFGTQKGVGGGNLILCGINQEATLKAAEAAVNAIDTVPGIITPFPGGIVRSGSKVGSKYKNLKASTNEAYCPTLKAMADSLLDENIGAVYEIVIDGFSEKDVQNGMKAGLQSASQVEGLKVISAGNYGGNLGPFHFYLKEIVT